MESDLGKLFIGGISWDTDENRLKEYFGGYGEVVEAVIMRDRTTGRARGFGFIIFADPSVAERVVMEKHMIDGRNVEAKKAVPRDDQQIINRTNSTINGSPGPGRTKKIFVGGLASTVTESDFKTYFDQFGTITDVVVMYDHNTQRPRGFGFISYDSEEAVDRVLHKTFHELNGKMVEVKRAVPKELSSPGLSRSPISPLIGLNYGLSRENSFLNNYVPGYNMSPVSGYGMRMDGRFNPIGNGRNGYSPFGSSGYGMGMNFESGLSPSFNGSSNLTNNLGYGRMLSPYSNGNSNRIITPIGYNASNGRNGSVLTSTNRNVWGNESLNNGPISPGAYLGSGRGGFGVSFGNNGSNWGMSPFASQNAGNSLDYFSGNPEYGNGGNGYSLGGRNNGISSGHQTSSFVSSSNGYEGSYGDVYRDGSVYGDSTWRTSASELDGTGSFGYGLNNAASDVVAKSSEDYIGNFNVTNRQSNRGIAA